MTNLSRPDFIELLNRLGAESDETALKAARDLHRSLVESGMTWDDLLLPDEEPSGEPAEAMNGEPAGALAPDDLSADDEPAEAEVEAKPVTADKPVPANRAEDARIIDRLLTRKNLSKEMRTELSDLKRGIAEGSFDKMDSDYIRALAKRLDT